MHASPIRPEFRLLRFLTPPGIDALSLALSLACIAAAPGRRSAAAQDTPPPDSVSRNPARASAAPSPRAPLSSEPAVVVLDPKQIPNYRFHRTDITDVLQDAINSTSGPLKILLPAGHFVVNKGNIRISRDFVQIEGAGNGQTILHFMPNQTSVDQGQAALFVFQKPDSSTLSGAGLKDCMIVSDEVSLRGLNEGVDEYTPEVQSPHSKVAIRLVNTSLFRAENVSIDRWWGETKPSGGSIGLQIRGREAGGIQRLFIQADIPIRIEPNGDPGLRWIGIDHFHFSDLFLIASGRNPCIHILPNTPLTNTTFDGYQTWNRGGFGLKWDGGGDTFISIGLAVKNARWEQATAPGGYMIHISPGATLHNLTLSNLNSVSQHPPRAGETAEPIINGIYLRNVTNVAIEDFFFDGPSIGLKFDPLVVPGSAPRPSVTNVTMTGVYFPKRGTQVDLSGGLRMTGGYVRDTQSIRIDDGQAAPR